MRKYFPSGSKLVAEARQDSSCARCRKEIYLPMDYDDSFFLALRPFEKGGKYDADNCVLICHKCAEEVEKQYGKDRLLNSDDFKYYNYKRLESKPGFFGF